MTQAKTLDVRSLLLDGLGVIFKRKKLILGLFLIVALGISFAILSIPTSYEVTGKLVVMRSRGDLLVSPSESKNFNFMVTAPTVQDMAVHAELLKNRSLLEAAARTLGLDRQRADTGRPPAAEASGEPKRTPSPVTATLVPAPSGPSRLDAVVDAITAGLTVQVVPNSNLILVKYRSADPVKGAQILNTLLDLYLDQYLNLRARHGFTEFFVEQRDRSEDTLRKTEAALKAFQRRVGLLNPSVQADAYARRAAEAEANYIDATHDQKEAEARIEAIKAKIAGTPERVQRVSTIKLNPMLQTLQQSLLTLEIQRRQLLALYTENDRRVTDINGQIEALKKQIGEAPQYVPDTEETELNQVRRELEDKLFGAQTAVSKNKFRIQGALKTAAEMKAELAAMGLAEVEKEALIREIQASSDAYLLYRKKVEEARITAAMDDSKIMNVTIGEKASRQGMPVGPPKNLSLLFAVMVGLVSGVGAAFLREFFDGSIKTEGEIRAAVDLPVLGSIPEEKKGRHGKHHREPSGS